MRHFHNKVELSDNDVKYVVVEKGQNFRIEFNKVDKQFDKYPVSQGIKLWLNRCRLIIDNVVVPIDRIIIWHSEEKKETKKTNEHSHFFTDDFITFQVTETVDENPNIGIFNVWTFDQKRCYEFAGESFIEETKKKDKTIFKAGHGLTKNRQQTIEFELKKENKCT